MEFCSLAPQPAHKLHQIPYYWMQINRLALAGTNMHAPRNVILCSSCFCCINVKFWSSKSEWTTLETSFADTGWSDESLDQLDSAKRSFLPVEFSSVGRNEFLVAEVNRRASIPWLHWVAEYRRNFNQHFVFLPDSRGARSFDSATGLSA